MVAPRGNQYWRLRRQHGPKPKYENPKLLWRACCRYLDWVVENPLELIKLYSVAGELRQEGVPKVRAMSLHGLCVFLGISHATWHRYRQRPDFIDMMNCVESIIRTQKFEGAAASLLNASIISKDLRLGERPEPELGESGNDGKLKVDADVVTRKLLHGPGARSEGGEA